MESFCALGPAAVPREWVTLMQFSEQAAPIHRSDLGTRAEDAHSPSTLGQRSGALLQLPKCRFRPGECGPGTARGLNISRSPLSAWKQEKPKRPFISTVPLLDFGRCSRLRTQLAVARSGWASGFTGGSGVAGAGSPVVPSRPRWAAALAGGALFSPSCSSRLRVWDSENFLASLRLHSKTESLDRCHPD